MINFKVDVQDGEYERAKARFFHLENDMKLEAGEALVKIIDDGLRKRVIPDDSGWVQWYLDSIRWERDVRKMSWDLVVDEDIEKDEIPPGRSLIWIRGSWRYLVELSPWPMGLIPRLRGKVPGHGLVRPVSADEYSFHEKRVEGKKEEIKSWLNGQGLTASPVELEFEDGFEVDVDFLVTRIEHGLGGFVRQPHFTFIRRQIEKRFG